MVLKVLVQVELKCDVKLRNMVVESLNPSVVNAFFGGAFISFLLHEFYNHNVIKWNITSKNIMLT